MSSRPWENDSCATVQACYSVYAVPVAAALWCGVPPGDVAAELRQAVPVGQNNALARATLRHPYLKCLEPRIRAIHAAIDSGELPTCREDGRAVANDDHVAYERRHVYGLDLKEWAKKIAPTERPAFLFDDIEREAHAGISADVYNTLKAAHDAKEQKLGRAHERIRELEDERGRLESECRSLRAMVDDMAGKFKDAWLAWPVKVSPFIAAELDVDIDRLTTLLAEAVYQQLLELSEARADFSGDG